MKEEFKTIDKLIRIIIGNLFVMNSLFVLVYHFWNFYFLFLSNLDNQKGYSLS